MLSFDIYMIFTILNVYISNVYIKMFIVIQIDLKTHSNCTVIKRIVTHLTFQNEADYPTHLFT